MYNNTVDIILVGKLKINHIPSYRNLVLTRRPFSVYYCKEFVVSKLRIFFYINSKIWLNFLLHTTKCCCSKVQLVKYLRR